MGAGIIVDFLQKDRYDINDLLLIMQKLRAPDGCPWDREQTHESLRNGLIEETYEAVEAIDTANRDLLEEELGDVLLQVVSTRSWNRRRVPFHLQMWWTA